MQLVVGLIILSGASYLYDRYWNVKPTQPETKESDVDDVARAVAALSITTIPQAERRLDLQTEPRIARIQDRRSDALSLAIESAKAQNVMLTELINKVRSMVYELRECINDAAIKELFLALQRDPEISSHVFSALRTDWECNGGALIGTAIKENREILTTARRAEILKAARSRTSENDIRVQLQNFGRRLHADVARGRQVVTTAVAQRYPELYKLKKLEKMTKEQEISWQNAFQRLVNEAYLHQERRHSHNSLSATGAFVETKLLQALELGRGDEYEVGRQKAEGEMKVIRLLMEGEGLEQSSLDELIALLAKRKQEARLLAAGVQEARLADYITTIGILEEGYSSMIQASEEWKKTIVGLPDSVPPKARRLCLLSKAAFVDSRNSHKMMDHIRLSADALKAGALGPINLKALQIPPTLQKRISDGSLYTYADQKLVERSDFYKNWGHRLVGEMIQGLDDDDSVLHGGACLGITTRLVCNEQRFPHFSAEEFVEISAKGEVKSRDRFRQLQHHFSMLKFKDEYVEQAFSASFLKLQKIKKVTSLFAVDCDVKDAARLLKVEIEKRKKKLLQSNGVIAIVIKRHILYIRIDTSRNIYRMGDVNVGIFNFPPDKNPEDELYACFNDLLHTLYPDNDHIRGLQFELA